MKLEIKLAKATIDRLPKGERKGAMDAKIVEQTEKVNSCLECCIKCVVLYEKCGSLNNNNNDKTIYIEPLFCRVI